MHSNCHLYLRIPLLSVNKMETHTAGCLTEPTPKNWLLKLNFKGRTVTKIEKRTETNKSDEIWCNASTPDKIFTF